MQARKTSVIGYCTYNNNNNIRLMALYPGYLGDLYQKGKTNLDLLEQEIVSGSGIRYQLGNMQI